MSGLEQFKQGPIPKNNQRPLLRLRVEQFKKFAAELADRLYSGEITLGEWEESMRTQLRLLHAGATAIGKGSWDAVTSVDWGRVDTTLREQYQYLHNFAQDIYNRGGLVAEGAIAITAAMIAWRAGLYGDKAFFSMDVAQAADFLMYLPWMPGDGSTECQVHCFCSWIFYETDLGNGNKSVIAEWTLAKAEHCNTCMDRQGFQVTFEVPVDTYIPPDIGGP